MLYLVESSLVFCVHAKTCRRKRLSPRSRSDGMIIYGFVVVIGVLAYYLTERSREKA
jgi:hypothetical protein